MTENTPNNKLFETNGAKALFLHKYYPNAIVKFHGILQKYPDTNTCGEIQLYLGRSFEAINENGRALDAFETVIEAQNTNNCASSLSAAWKQEAALAIQRLKK